MIIENSMGNKTCPECGSESVVPAGNRSIEYILEGFTNHWICEECGFEGPINEGDEGKGIRRSISITDMDLKKGKALSLLMILGFGYLLLVFLNP